MYIYLDQQIKQITTFPVTISTPNSSYPATIKKIIMHQ